MITTRWVSSHLAPTLWGLPRRRRQDRRLTRVSISLIELTLGMINDHGSQHHYKSVKSVRHSADADINYTLLAGTLRTFPLECLSHHRYISHSDLNIRKQQFPFSAKYQKTIILSTTRARRRRCQEALVTRWRESPRRGRGWRFGDSTDHYNQYWLLWLKRSLITLTQLISKHLMEWSRT